MHNVFWVANKAICLSTAQLCDEVRYRKQTREIKARAAVKPRQASSNNGGVTTFGFSSTGSSRRKISCINRGGRRRRLRSEDMKAAIDKDKHWYVVRTNVKAEVKASDNMRKAGYDVYYPRRRMEMKNKRTHTYATRESALMPRYLFVGLPQSDRNFFKVRNCDGVECILGVDGPPERISAEHVEAIYLAEIEMQFDDTRAAGSIENRMQSRRRQQRKCSSRKVRAFW